MTRLLGCSCNQPERLAEALESARGALVVQPPVSRWGLGYIQGGHVLISRTPRLSSEPVDFYPPLSRLRSHYVIGHASAPDDLAGNANTQPFRHRRWLFAQDSTLGDFAAAQAALAPHIPDFLRRNIHGKTLAEHVFYVFLSLLHDTKSIDDVNLPLADARHALHTAVTLVRDILARAGVEFGLGNLVTSNGRSLVAVRLGEPLFMRNLTIRDESSRSDESTVFRGVLAVSATAQPGEGFEEIPDHNVLMVGRDLRFEVGRLGG